MVADYFAPHDSQWLFGPFRAERESPLLEATCLREGAEHPVTYCKEAR